MSLLIVALASFTHCATTSSRTVLCLLLSKEEEMVSCTVSMSTAPSTTSEVYWMM